MSHPDQLPDLFVDRSLVRIQVPALLRRAGLRLVTLAEHYGIPADQEVADRTWLEDAGKRGWAERFLHNLDAITAACAAPGPFIYAVYQRRILRLTL